MRLLLKMVAVATALLAAPAAARVVVDFDDLTAGSVVPESYAGITWELGKAGYDNLTGRLQVVTPGDGGAPFSKPHCVANQWGVRQVMIRFQSGPVDFHGAYFAYFGAEDSFYAPLVGFVGFHTEDDPNPELAAFGPGFEPHFLNANFHNVIKVQITSAPGSNNRGGGWYCMDNLAYTPVPEPATAVVLGSGVLAMAGSRLRKRHKNTQSAP